MSLCGLLNSTPHCSLHCPRPQFPCILSRSVSFSDLHEELLMEFHDSNSQHEEYLLVEKLSIFVKTSRVGIFLFNFCSSHKFVSYKSQWHSLQLSWLEMRLRVLDLKFKIYDHVHIGFHKEKKKIRNKNLNFFFNICPCLHYSIMLTSVLILDGMWIESQSHKLIASQIYTISD